MWPLIDGACGTAAGCLVWLVIMAIRASARFSVSTWDEIEPEWQQDEMNALYGVHGRPAGHDKETEKIPV